MLNTSVQSLIDTGAKLSCVSEELLHCNELFKNIKIRKSDRRAYGVNGEPVVTLGIIEAEFKIDDLIFRHEFTVLRGLIHPMLLGMDFLVKYRARIDLGTQPNIQLLHPLRRIAKAPLIKAMPKQKPVPHVAAVREFEIPP